MRRRLTGKTIEGGRGVLDLPSSFRALLQRAKQLLAIDLDAMRNAMGG